MREKKMKEQLILILPSYHVIIDVHKRLSFEQQMQIKSKQTIFNRRMKWVFSFRFFFVVWNVVDNCEIQNNLFSSTYKEKNDDGYLFGRFFLHLGNEIIFRNVFSRSTVILFDLPLFKRLFVTSMTLMQCYCALAVANAMHFKSHTFYVHQILYGGSIDRNFMPGITCVPSMHNNPV